MAIFYNDLLSLSPRLLDTLNVYVEPIVSLFTFICGVICFIVLSSRRLRGIVYQHLFLDSIATMIYGFSNSFTWIIRCGPLCGYGYSYWSKFYEIYFFIYLAKALELFIFLLELNLAIMRLSSFKNLNKKVNQNKEKIVFRIKVAAFLIIAFLTSIPVIILPRKISLAGYLIQGNETVSNDTSHPLYVVGKSELGLSAEFGYAMLALSVLQGIGLLFVLFIINLINTYKLIKFLRKKKQTAAISAANEKISRKETKISVLTIVICINCIIGYFPNKLSVNAAMYFLSFTAFNIYVAFSNMLIWFSHGIKLFIHLGFNDEFRQTFMIKFCRRNADEVGLSAMRDTSMTSMSVAKRKGQN